MYHNQRMFGIDVIKERLLEADENIALEFPKERFDIYIVGGAALMLYGQNKKMTNDIDVIYVSDKKISSVLFEGVINQRVLCTVDSFSSEYETRLIKINLGETLALNFYMLSLEDIVSSKLYAGRPKDMEDLNNPIIYKSIDWEMLDKIIYTEMKQDAMNERRWKDLVYAYEQYKEGYYEWKKVNV